MITFTHTFAASKTHTHKAARLYQRLKTFLHHHPHLSSLSFARLVAVFLHSLQPRLVPTSIRTYLRLLNFHSVLHSGPSILRDPELNLLLQAIFHAKDASPSWRAAPLTPAQLALLQHAHLHHRLPTWLLVVWEASYQAGARPSDLLTPITVQQHGTLVIVTIVDHKTAGGGLRQPPLRIPFPPGRVASFLLARGHPRIRRHLFPECRSTEHLKTLTRQFLPEINLYAGRNAFANDLASSIELPQLSRMMGHTNLATTRQYLRHVASTNHHRDAAVIAGRTGVCSPPFSPRF